MKLKSDRKDENNSDLDIIRFIADTISESIDSQIGSIEFEELFQEKLNYQKVFAVIKYAAEKMSDDDRKQMLDNIETVLNKRKLTK